MFKKCKKIRRIPFKKRKGGEGDMPVIGICTEAQMC